MYDKVDFWVSAWFLALIVCAVCPVPRWLCYTVFFLPIFYLSSIQNINFNHLYSFDFVQSFLCFIHICMQGKSLSSKEKYGIYESVFVVES